MPLLTGSWAAVGRGRLTVSTTSVVLPSIPTTANCAFITVEAQPIRYTIDGTVPVATSLGHLAIAAGVIELLSRDALMKFQAIRDGATDAVLEITYGYRQGP